MEKGELGVLTRYELEKLMRRNSRERARAVKKFLEDAHSLKVGEEMYRNYDSNLPFVSELRDSLNSLEDMRFEIHETINGYTVKRTA